jgi:aspartyl-tRNA(Asn)/glutamyl-tRNA(Gln) amidotransferase subunit B
MHGHLDLTVDGAGAKERPAWEDMAADGTPIERAEDGSYTAPIRILRIHMEEDAAKMVHSGGEEGRITGAAESFVDYNRCGTPLIELVTEPDLRTPEEARLFMEKLQQTFRTLGISDCSLESGSMRCDGNISLRRRGETKLGTKTEMKNINSFKSLHDALEYEIRRQAEVLEEGGIIYQETRHWEPSKRRTVVMRVKETADDYRLMPDPDLAPFDLTDDFIDDCRSRIPELPDEKCARYERDYGLKHADAAQLAGDPDVSKFFEEALDGADKKTVPTVANVMVNLVPGHADVKPAQIQSLSKLLAEDAITFAQAREVLDAVDGTDKDPAAVVDERGMRQVSDAGALEPIVDEVLSRCTDQVAQYQGGNKKVLGYLVGQCMKASKGKGNPKRFNEMLREKLG